MDELSRTLFRIIRSRPGKRWIPSSAKGRKCRSRTLSIQEKSVRDQVQSRLDKELAIIEMKQLAGYFLIVNDISDFCRKNKILSQGRGSAANSVVCYASASRPSIRSRTIFSLNDFCPKNTSNIPTSTSTCPRATTASRSSSTFTTNTAAAVWDDGECHLLSRQISGA